MPEASVGTAVRQPALFQHDRVAVAVQLDHAAGAGAVGGGLDKDRCHQTLQVHADAGIGQFAVRRLVVIVDHLHELFRTAVGADGVRQALFGALHLGPGIVQQAVAEAVNAGGDRLRGGAAIAQIPEAFRGAYQQVEGAVVVLFFGQLSTELFRGAAAFQECQRQQASGAFAGLSVV